MKDYLKRAVGGASSSLELYRKLPRSRRVAFIVVAGVIAAGAVASLVPAGGERLSIVASGDGEGGPSRLHRAASVLSENGIPWQESRTDAGVPAISVSPGEVHLRALALLSREGLAPPALEEERGGAASWLETPDRLEARLRDANLRKIQEGILLNKSIIEATIATPPPGRRRYVLDRREEDSAAVALRLRSGVASLQRHEVDAIRSLVSCALSLRPEKISITDGARRYDEAAESDGAVLEKEDRVRRRITISIEEYFRRAYGSGEFYVAALVSVSPQRTSIEKKAVDPENTITRETQSEIERGTDRVQGGLISESRSPVTLREITISMPFESFEKTSIEIPPGDVSGVSVVVHLDLRAVENAMDAESTLRGSRAPGGTPEGGGLLPAHEREERIGEYVARQEACLREFLSIFGKVSAAVMVHPFLERGAADPGPVPAPAVAGVGFPGEGLVSWPGSTGMWRLAAIGLAMILLLLIGLRSARRGRGRVSEWQRDATAPHQPPFRPSTARGGGDGILRGVDEVSAAVRERPEVAAGVLRFWLAQDREEIAEEAREGARAG